MTENFSEIINEETAPQKLLQWSGEYERTCGHKPLALIHSYGCQQNVNDGEKIKGMLSKVGYDFTSDVNEAQLILYNTCAVRENAEDKVFGIIGNEKMQTMCEILDLLNLLFERELNGGLRSE